MTEVIKVVIADDHALFREMLFHTLSEEEDIAVVGQAKNGVEALEKVKEHGPDILLLDIDMPLLNGLEVTCRVIEESPATKVVILTALDDEQLIFRLIKAGATGYILKDAHSKEVISAIRSAHSGEPMIQPRVMNKILREFVKLIREKESIPRKGRRENLDILSEREKEVLSLMAKGLNNREISEALIISEPTVKTHVANVMRKLNLRDRVEVVIFAFQSGLME
jgi:two-component system response regulator DegU